MIGDWVFCDGKCYQIAEIGGMVCLDAEKEIFASLEDITPIPITPEILEKNGFKPDGSGQISYCLLTPFGIEGLRYSIYVGLRQKTIEVHAAHTVLKKDNWRKVNKTYLEVCGPYVHELQHALKLCGIDKEIKL